MEAQETASIGSSCGSPPQCCPCLTVSCQPRSRFTNVSWSLAHKPPPSDIDAVGGTPTLDLRSRVVDWPLIWEVSKDYAWLGWLVQPTGLVTALALFKQHNLPNDYEELTVDHLYSLEQLMHDRLNSTSASSRSNKTVYALSFIKGSLWAEKYVPWSVVFT